MNQKTKIKSSKKQKEALQKQKELENSEGYQIGREIVMEIAEDIITNVVGLYEEYQKERLDSEIIDMFDKGNSTMMSFEALSSIRFQKKDLVVTSYEEIEPLVLDPDNYNRKVLEHVEKLSAPRSAIELWDKSLNKIKSASVLSRLARKSVKKQFKPQGYLQVDFSKINLHRVNSMDHQLRKDKANSRIKNKNARNAIKVN